MLNLSLQATLLVMLGSALGGGARLWVSTLITRGTGAAFPWGTLGVNIAGCLAVGILAALFAPPGRIHDLQHLRLIAITGFLGGFTTFSAFAVETVLLIERGQTLAAAGYVLASTIGCVLAAALTYFGLAAALR